MSAFQAVIMLNQNNRWAGTSICPCQCEGVCQDEICESHTFALGQQHLQLILMTGSTHFEAQRNEMSSLPQKGTPFFSSVHLYYKRLHQKKLLWKFILFLFCVSIL